MMGLFRVRVHVFDLKDETRTCEVEMLVDTGSNMALIPSDVVRELGLTTVEFRTFTLANGVEIVRPVGRAGLSTAGRSTACDVVLGEPGDGAILGAIPLEGMGLEVDPRRRELRPTAQYLMKVIGGIG
jgi:clan AA aspartic protease